MLISQVQTVADARRAVQVGADIIIAQGQDSGGHGRRGRGTMSLVPAIVDAVGPVPVVAAGGIADGRGLAAALMLGAAGVTLGTRLYASNESISDPAADELLVSRSGDDTVRTAAFDDIRGPAWPVGYDGRVIVNSFVGSWDDRHGTQRETLEDTYRGAADNDYSIQPLWAGEGLDLIDAITPAAEIIARIVADASRLLETASSSLRE